MRHDNGRAIGRLDDLCHGVGFAGTGDAKQDLVLLTVDDTPSKSVDGGALITLGLVVADEMEIHCGFYYRGRGEVVRRPLRQGLKRSGSASSSLAGTRSGWNMLCRPTEKPVLTRR